MVINLQDRNLIVNYLQIFLRDVFGITLRKVSDLNDIALTNVYEITVNDPIKVTGSYNTQTYLSLALYMAFNYPNEGYPYKWEMSQESSSEWIAYPYEPSKLRLTLQTVAGKVSFPSKGTNETEDNYENQCREVYKKFYLMLPEEIVKSQDVYDYDGLLRYFLNAQMMSQCINGLESKEDVTDDTVRGCLVNVLVANLNSLAINPVAAQVPERVLAYVFNEVASSLSEEDEIYRVQKLLYSKIPREIAGKYDVPLKSTGKSTMDLVRECQQKFIDDYTRDGVTNLPSNYSGFKATGYFDPWTELMVRSKNGGDQ